jgi:hypothetical protein
VTFQHAVQRRTQLIPRTGSDLMAGAATREDGLASFGILGVGILGMGIPGLGMPEENGNPEGERQNSQHVSYPPCS